MIKKLFTTLFMLFAVQGYAQHWIYTSGKIYILNAAATDTLFTLNAGTNQFSFQHDADDDSAFYILDKDGGTPIFLVNAVNERVGIRTLAPTEALDVTGNIAVSGTVDGKDIATNAGMLNENETITGNWVNTTNPWADNEVANNITIDLATLATTLTITDNESTSETNAILFTSAGDLDGGNLGIESDGDLTYTPNTGNISATQFGGITEANLLDKTAAEAITGVWEIADDINFDFGTDADWSINYDESVDNQLLFITTNTAAVATTDPMFEILVGTTPTANQQVFGVAKGTQATNTALFTVDEDGDGEFAGGLTLGTVLPIAQTALVAGTNITLSTNTLNVDDAFLVNNAADEMLLADATTNTVTDILTLSHTGGTVAAGFGTGLRFDLEDLGGLEEQANIHVSLDVVTDGAEEASIIFRHNVAGTMQESMRIDGTAGFVGINNSSPAGFLDIIQGTTSSFIRRNADQYLQFETSASGNIIRGFSDDAGPKDTEIHSDEGFFFVGNTGVTIDLDNDFDGTTDVFVIRDGGNNVLFQVNENDAFTGIGTSSPDGLLNVESLTTDADIFLTADESSQSIFNMGDENDNNIQKIVSDHTSDYLAFFTNNAERLRIDSNGNVVIGTTSANDVEPDFSIVVDADSDAGGDTDDRLTIALVPVADPTTATWDFTSTQSAGYTFDKGVTLKLGNLDIGQTSANDTQPDLSITGDADSDGAGDTDDTFKIVLTPNATPTVATWDFTSTQSAGYTFDKLVTGTSFTASATVTGEQLTSTDDADVNDNLTVGDIIVDEAAGVIDGTGATSFTLSATGSGTVSIASGDNFEIVSGNFVQETFVIRKHVALSGATDATATNWFTITTTNESGSADGGSYSVSVHLVANEAGAASGAVNTASVSLNVNWTRIMASAGTGANSAVIEVGESASADEGTGAISAVTVTVTETDEFIQQVLLDVNTSGGTFDGFGIVELVYTDFTTPPSY